MKCFKLVFFLSLSLSPRAENSLSSGGSAAVPGPPAGSRRLDGSDYFALENESISQIGRCFPNVLLWHVLEELCGRFSARERSHLQVAQERAWLHSFTSSSSSAPPPPPPRSHVITLMGWDGSPTGRGGAIGEGAEGEDLEMGWGRVYLNV